MIKMNREIKSEYIKRSHDEMSEIFNISPETEELVVNQVLDSITKEYTTYIGLYRDLHQNNELKIGYSPTLNKEGIIKWRQEMLTMPNQITFCEIFEIKKLN